MPVINSCDDQEIDGRFHAQGETYSGRERGSMLRGGGEDGHGDRHHCERAPADEQAESWLADTDATAVGIEAQRLIAGPRAGGALEADAAVVELLEQDPAGAPLLLEDLLEEVGSLEAACRRAHDLELPSFGEFLGTVAGHGLLLLFTPPSRSCGCGGSRSTTVGHDVSSCSCPDRSVASSNLL